MSDLLKGIFENVFEDTTDKMSDDEEINDRWQGRRELTRDKLTS